MGGSGLTETRTAGCRRTPPSPALCSRCGQWLVPAPRQLEAGQLYVYLAAPFPEANHGYEPKVIDSDPPNGTKPTLGGEGGGAVTLPA